MSVVSIGALRTRSTSPGSCSNHPQKKFSENSCPKREFFVFRKTPRHSVRAAKNRQRGISRFGRSRRFASVGLAPGFAMTKNPQRGCGKPEKHSKIVSESLGKWKNAKHNGEVIFAAIPSLRAKPHESWELVPLDELSLAGILQRWNQRFQVSGMRRRSNPCWHLVIARRDSTVAICAGFPSLRGAITPWQSKPAVRHCEQGP